MLNIKMKIKAVFFSFIYLLVALAVNPANAKNKTNLSKSCSNYLKEFYKVQMTLIENFKALKNQNYYLQTLLKRMGTEDVKIKAITYKEKDKQHIFGFKYEWKDQSIIDCWSFYHTPMITLVEKYDHFDPFFIIQNEAIKISTHFFVNCGVPCYHAEVTAAYMIDDGTIPYIRKEITTPTFEYPSIWFRDYLTLEELFQFMKTENGFENFQWRGRHYKTSKLAKKIR